MVVVDHEFDKKDREKKIKPYKNSRIRASVPISEFLVNKDNNSKICPTKKEKNKVQLIKRGFQNLNKESAIKKFINSSEKHDDVTTHIWTEREEYDDIILEFLKTLKAKFDTKWKQNENKARSRRVLVCGIHETLKHLDNGNIISVFVSRNLDDIVQNYTGSSNFYQLVSAAIAKNIPVIHTGTKKTLSRCVNKYPYINVIGLICCPGFESQLPIILDEWKHSRSHIFYHIDQNSLFA